MLSIRQNLTPTQYKMTMTNNNTCKLPSFKANASDALDVLDFGTEAKYNLEIKGKNYELSQYPVQEGKLGFTLNSPEEENLQIARAGVKLNCEKEEIQDILQVMSERDKGFLGTCKKLYNAIIGSGYQFKVDGQDISVKINAQDLLTKNLIKGTIKKDDEVLAESAVRIIDKKYVRPTYDFMKKLINTPPADLIDSLKFKIKRESENQKITISVGEEPFKPMYGNLNLSH
ncbi:MAG: hypothetical protein WCK67_08680 [bacterium]